MTTIAVVTSITFGGNLRTCFEAGLNASGAHSVTIPPPYEAKGNYSLLPTYVQNAASTKPDLIVAAGGLPTAIAAAQNLNQNNGDPQFVYLSGILLNTMNKCNSGGANQNVPMENQARKEKLTDPPLNVPDASRIWLVVNNNNQFSGAEINAWGNANVQPFFQGSPNNPPANTNDNSNNNNFIQEFHNLAIMATPPLGLVISPDPYFRHWRTAFTIALADQLPVPVCYPYGEFVDAANTTGNAGNSTSLNLPHLARPSSANPTQIAATAYYQLGLKAGQYLIAKASGHPTQFVGVTTWDAVSKKWGP
jgi:hypothetical protein